MNFSLKFKIEASRYPIEMGRRIVLLGSCFSDNFVAPFQQSGFQTVSNPFGTIYHPLAMMAVLECVLDENKNLRTFEKDGRFYSWDASTKVSGSTNSELDELLSQKVSEVRRMLSEGAHLFVTFGTAWRYRHFDAGWVANCHKVPGNEFEKHLSEGHEVVSQWSNMQKRLIAAFPDLTIVYTVSPVRHVRDGLIENNQSKARLIESVHTLVSREKRVEYFPSYEILTDELRDYRFYANDMVHPSDLAIHYIWQRLCSSYFSKKTEDLRSEIASVNRMSEHRSMHETEKQRKSRTEWIREKKQTLSDRYPEIFWE